MSNAHIAQYTHKRWTRHDLCLVFSCCFALQHISFDFKCFSVNDNVLEHTYPIGIYWLTTVYICMHRIHIQYSLCGGCRRMMNRAGTLTNDECDEWRWKRYSTCLQQRHRIRWHRSLFALILNGLNKYEIVGWTNERNAHCLWTLYRCCCVHC